MNPATETAAARRRPVVVAGAGPVGMAAALALRSLGLPATVLEAGPADRVRPGSRAIFVHEATLQVLDRIRPGLAGTLASHGLAWRTRRTFVRGKQVYARTYPPPEAGRLPHFISLPQAEIERHLLEACESAGAELVWNQEVSRVDTGPDGLLVSTDTGEPWAADYLIAADGARSVVRGALGIQMEGTRSHGWYVVVDVYDDHHNALAVERVFHYQHPAAGFRNVLLVPFSGGWRIDLQCEEDDDAQALSAPEGLRRWLPRVVGPEYAERVSWVSTYRFLQVVARSFTDPWRRVLLAGEAAHLFAPFGARGLNSGIADAESAANAVHIALAAANRARAHAAVDEFALARRAAGRHNRDAASAALAHLRPDRATRLRIMAATALAPRVGRFGHWLETAPYGPRSSPSDSTVYKY